MSGREIVPLIPVPDPDDLGECMCACTLGERAWVIAKLETGADNSECARLAGYSTSSPDVIKSTGYAIAHRQRVQDALLEQSRKLLKTELPRSLRTLIELRDDKKIKADIRLKAAIQIMDRAGMAAVQESHLTITHERSMEELVSIIQEYAPKLGIKAADILGYDASGIVDAEFSEVVEPISADERAARDRRNETRQRRRQMSPDQRAAENIRIRAERSARAKAKYAKAQGELTGREGLEDLF